MSPKILRYCGLCAHSWIDKKGRVHCGHSVDDESLKWGDRGTNPIWAERKYGSMNVLATLAGRDTHLRTPGTDPENMQFDDGQHCKVWRHVEAK